MSPPADALLQAYDRFAGAWSGGPQRVYGQLARVLVGAAGTSLAGWRALDAGTGGGAVARALVDAGATVVAADAVPGPLRADAASRPPAVVADVTRLPVRDGAVDVAAAGFVLSHLVSPVDGLRELARVTRPGGLVLASAFATGPPEPVKATVEAVATRHGYVRPQWYETLKQEAEPRMADAGAVRTAAEAAGLWPLVRCCRVSVRLQPVEAVEWRLGMPALAGFVAGLPAPRRTALVADARAALGSGAVTVRLPVLLLRGAVPYR